MAPCEYPISHRPPHPEGGFYGIYCHNDGYPAHQGRILFDAVTGHFDGAPDAACRYLIDQHPAGWPVLGGDFTVPPGYRTGHDPQDLRNQCYCHGDRQEPPRPPLTDHAARDAWVDYAYVLEAKRLRVLHQPRRLDGSRWPRRPGPSGPTGTHRPARPTPHRGW